MKIWEAMRGREIRTATGEPSGDGRVMAPTRFRSCSRLGDQLRNRVGAITRRSPPNRLTADKSRYSIAYVVSHLCTTQLFIHANKNLAA